MLVALSIRSFILIDRLDLEAETGFTALTGETGAGKSIILDALGLVLGGPANRQMVRVGDQQAAIVAEFCPSEAHPVWPLLTENGIEADRSETLTLRRVIQAKGPSRAFVNDQPVNATLLASIGETLVEIHSQHAASTLMRPSSHRGLLDAFAGNGELLQLCLQAWSAFEAARQVRCDLEAAATSAHERRDWLEFAVEDLGKLGPEAGEATLLASQRGVLLQSEKLTENIQEADAALRGNAIEAGLSKAARATERVLRIQGLESLDSGIVEAAQEAAEAVERTLIELAEARNAINALMGYTGHDVRTLERVETRLFALRAAGRKYDTDPDELCAVLEAHRAALAMCQADTAALEQARADERAARSVWDVAAAALTKARRAGAKRLETAIMQGLAPLHLGRVQVRIAFSPIAEEESGANGHERVEFEVETNPGTGFGPLRAIASGGELARFSLALKCALSDVGGIGTLIFDEADQGVGGAVSAAIGERLARLAEGRQVFAITHSPQVASCAQRQWRVLKAPDQTGGLRTHVAQLDDGQRLEEIARMLSGSSITDEARAAASKLLEAA